MWLRLVDVAGALAARTWAQKEDLVLGVVDPFCPWNEGSYRLDGSTTTERPDLRLDVRDLGAAFLGGFTVAELGRAGRVEELVPGAIHHADAAFRTDRAPWCPEIF